jgi:hypothetical protein
MAVAMAFVTFVTAAESTKQYLRQDEYSDGLPEGDGANSEHSREEVVPKQHDTGSKNKYTCCYRDWDEYGPFYPEAFSPLMSKIHHDF